MRTVNHLIPPELIKNFYVLLRGHAIAQALCGQMLSAEVRLRSQGSPCGLNERRSDTGTGFSYVI